MSEFCEHMEKLMCELDKRGIEFESLVYKVRNLHKEHVRFMVENREVSVIWGYVTTDNGGHGITYGWPGLLEVALLRYDETDFEFEKDPEPMTVQEIVEKYARRNECK